VNVSSSASHEPVQVGDLLRHWRSARRLSQLDLALQAEVSSRHLSYVETGKARPSREMVARLAEALEVPLRERNALLLAAGYAPQYRETGLGTAELELARRAVEFMLKQQEPYPAVVVDRHWNLLQPNEGAARLLGFLLGGPPPDTNLLRLVFRRDGLRGLIANWDEVAGDMIRRLHQESFGPHGTPAARDLIAEVLAYPGVPAHWHSQELTAPTTPLLTLVFRKDDRELRFFSTITTFGTPRDITLEELRIECSYPADEVTANACRELACR
jgi:transcriptional regulator with XRE-family HTH domain